MTKLKNNISLLEKINFIVVKMEKIMLIFLISEMVILAAVQILSRFVIKKPISWSEELLTYSFIWLSFIGASFALATNKHFEVDLFTIKLNVRTRKIIFILIKILMLVFTILMIKDGYRFASINKFQMMSIMPFSMFWPCIIVPLSGIFMFIHICTKIYKKIRRDE